MMDDQNTFRIFSSDGETVIEHITHCLAANGLQVIRSFDLRSACAPFTGNLCPHHGTAPCDCQLVILLVYGVGDTPVSLILHSHRGQTEIGWDTAPEVLPSPEQRIFILRSLDGAGGLMVYRNEQVFAAME